MIRVLLALSLRTNRGDRAALVLPIVSFALVTTLFLAVIGGAQQFWVSQSDEALIYQFFAMVALVLLLVPLTTLGAAAARLSARRRDERLATYRLLGAPASVVTTVAVLESAALAAIGACIGIVLSFGVLLLVGQIPFRGHAVGFAGVILPWWALIAIAAAVTMIATLSSMVSLRAVTISPLGVRTRSEAPRLHWVRVLIAVAVLAVSVILVQLNQFGPALMFVFIVGGFAAVMAVLNLVGPLVIAAFAKRQAARAKNAVVLVSARRIADDPKAAWRQVSGIAMTSFMSVFAGAGVSLMSLANQSAQQNTAAATLVGDIQTGLLVTVIGSFLMVACTAGVSQAADVLDRKDLARALSMLGMDVRVQDAARRRALMSPLRITALFSALAAIAITLPVAGTTLILAPLTFVVIAAVLALGIGLVWLGLAATRPLLKQVATL